MESDSYIFLENYRIPWYRTTIWALKPPNHMWIVSKIANESSFLLVMRCCIHKGSDKFREYFTWDSPVTAGRRWWFSKYQIATDLLRSVWLFFIFSFSQLKARLRADETTGKYVAIPSRHFRNDKHAPLQSQLPAIWFQQRNSAHSENRSSSKRIMELSRRIPWTAVLVGHWKSPYTTKVITDYLQDNNALSKQSNSSLIPKLELVGWVFGELNFATCL